MSQQLTPELQAIKQRIKSVWSNGDFGVVAEVLAPEELQFYSRLNVPKGSKVLDVACGSGTIALEASRHGANAKGLDIVEDLIRQAKERAAAEGLKAEFIVGDAEDLPYGDNEFDYVISMFGAMFAPRPEIAASELFRVCKPGGTVAMGNWTDEGEISEFFDVVASFAPPMPPGVPKPIEWGNREIITQRLGKYANDLKMNIRKLEMNFPMPPLEVTRHYFKYFGPTKTVYDMLDDAKRAEFEKALTVVWEKENTATDGSTRTAVDYVEVTALKK
jgi:ubiquinone/menaquinone biosynthesis C-methylase UbiE